MLTMDDSFRDLDAKDFYNMKIVNALAELLDEKPFGKIRVGDICAKAGVSRQTFYRHFETKASVVHWFWDFSAKKYLFRVGIDLNWHDSFEQNLILTQKNLDFFRTTSKEHGYESCIEYGCRRRMETLQETLTQHCGVEVTPELEFQIMFFAYAESRVLGRVAFLEQDKPLQPRELADMLETCVPCDLHRIIEDAVGKVWPEPTGASSPPDAPVAKMASERLRS